MPTDQLPYPAIQLLNPEHARLKVDISGVAFHPPYLIGPHGLVIFIGPCSADPVLLPSGRGEDLLSDSGADRYHFPADWLLECPGLGGHILPETIRDFCAVLWLLVHGRASELMGG